MKIKLIALDMDGTLLLDDFRSISPRNKEALEAAIKKGIEVVPATGRIRGHIPESVTEIEGMHYLISSNGAIVYDLKADALISANYIGSGTVEKIISVLNKRQLFYGVYYKGDNYIQKGAFDRLENTQQFDPGHLDFVRSVSLTVDSLYDFVLEHRSAIEKIDIPFLSDHELRVLWQKFSNYKGIVLTGPIPNTIEVSHYKSNKREGLRELCHKLKINPQEVMAIGDSDNDLEMFEFAGFTVAMENATDELKALAKEHTLHYLEDGVAHAIEKFVL